MANAPTPFPVSDPAGADAMVVASATSGTPPTPKTQHRRAQAARARETQANLIESWVRAEADAEAAIRWTHRTLQGQTARDAMTASLDLWMWPSDSQASGEGNPDGGPGLHDTVVNPVARGGLQASGSAGGDDNDDIEIQGASRARSQSPSDAAVHTMQDDDVPSSRQVRGEPALGGGVGGGAWGPPDGGHSMAVDSVPDMAGAAVSAPPGVGGLGSGPRANEGGKRTGGHEVSTADDFRPAPNSPTVGDNADGPAGGTNTGRDVPGPARQTDDDGGDDAQHPGIQVAHASEDGIGHGSASGQARKRIRGSKGRKRR